MKEHNRAILLKTLGLDPSARTVDTIRDLEAACAEMRRRGPTDWSYSEPLMQGLCMLLKEERRKVKTAQ